MHNRFERGSHGALFGFVVQAELASFYTISQLYEFNLDSCLAGEDTKTLICCFAFSGSLVCSKLLSEKQNPSFSLYWRDKRSDKFSRVDAFLRSSISIVSPRFTGDSALWGHGWLRRHERDEGNIWGRHAFVAPHFFLLHILQLCLSFTVKCFFKMGSTAVNSS